MDSDSDFAFVDDEIAFFNADTDEDFAFVDEDKPPHGSTPRKRTVALCADRLQQPGEAAGHSSPASTPKRNRPAFVDFSFSSAELLISPASTACTSMESEDPLVHVDEEADPSATGRTPSPRCCQRNCLSYFSPYSLQEMKSAFQLKSNRDQRQFVLDLLSISTPRDADSHRLMRHLQLSLMGRDVCKTAFTQALGMSKRRLREVERVYMSGGVEIPRTQLRSSLLSTKHTNAVAWMNRYFNLIGDKMPHINQIHLPHFLSKKTVYELMVQELKCAGVSDVVSLSHFYAIWDSEFKTCTIPKVNG